MRLNFTSQCDNFKADVINSLVKLVSLRKLAPSRNAVFNQTGMYFVTEISFCIKTPVVDDKSLVSFRGCKSATEII